MPKPYKLENAPSRVVRENLQREDDAKYAGALDYLNQAKAQAEAAKYALPATKSTEPALPDNYAQTQDNARSVLSATLADQIMARLRGK